nr:immunoglobulin light chain junction region [Macaca mulatta]MOX85394.1 immunoglobulin light chain junction region [Macaca mulatta]MOX85444.1 immunoglobulin light chain junction region [Macaca mulatta]MOX86125.1 immunoglobulin light chain junction region [Macaca mulatta]MOX86237.1 immunoglobulin light chain junction region [Macaca mulatta]
CHQDYTYPPYSF